MWQPSGISVDCRRGVILSPDPVAYGLVIVVVFSGCVLYGCECHDTIWCWEVKQRVFRKTMHVGISNSEQPKRAMVAVRQPVGNLFIRWAQTILFVLVNILDRNKSAMNFFFWRQLGILVMYWHPISWDGPGYTTKKARWWNLRLMFIVCRQSFEDTLNLRFVLSDLD